MQNKRKSKSVARIPFICEQSDASLNSLRQGLIVVSRLQRVGSFEERAGGWGAPSSRNKGILAFIFTLDRSLVMYFDIGNNY